MTYAIALVLALVGALFTWLIWEEISHPEFSSIWRIMIATLVMAAQFAGAARLVGWL